MGKLKIAIVKYCFCLIAGLFLSLGTYAQYGNEWIRFNQTYFKIPVAKDGIYRLTYDDLQAAGFSASDHSRIQLFHRGQEQAIHIFKSSGGASFGAGDYIEFYGMKNTGVGEAELYRPSSSQPHQYYSLYTDASAYFLTVNTQGQSGKRMEVFSEVNISGIPAEISHNAERLQVLASQYSTGIQYGSGAVQNSFFDIGEGWTGNRIDKDQFLDYVIDNILFGAVSSGSPQLEIQINGRADVVHNVEISVGPASPSRLLTTASFSGFGVINVVSPLNWTDIGADGKISVRVKALGTGSTGDRLSASYIKITYPQNFNMNQAAVELFNLNQNGSDKSFIQIQNAPAGVRLFDISDPAEVVMIGSTSSATLDAVIDNTSSSRKILASGNFLSPAINKVLFRNIDPSLHDYIIVSHTSLMQSGGGYANPIKGFAGYRASDPGGAFDTLTMDIHQLYDQFNFGEVSPLAISRFMKFMVDGGDPRYLFLIGKGLDVKWDYYRNPSAFPVNKDLVPTAGMPGSDILYTAGLDGTNFEPAVPTGRITARTPQEVAAYLKKVKEMEALPFDDLWRKNILHLSGGIHTGEPEYFKQILEGVGAIAEDYYLGGHVTAIPKGNTEIEFINISDQVNHGVNLITLFGHSTENQNDFNIGYASAPELGYNNKGKYPMFLINGCNAGEFFGNSILYGEDWILAADKGALGFLANTSFGFVPVLQLYSSNFYETAYGDSSYISKGIGDIQKSATKDFMTFSTDYPFIAQAQQMILLGDPAVNLFGASKPDYEINDNSVYAESFNGEPITSRSESFAIKIIVRNFGRAKEDSVTVSITQLLNDNSSVTYDSAYLPVLYTDTLTFKIPKNEKGFGINTFNIEIDSEHIIGELSESNNTASLEFTIPLNASRNLFPQGFSIVNSQSVNLIVQSTDLLGAARDFIIQIDTVDSFDSPYGSQAANTFTVSGKIASTNFQIYTGKDTLAYYWRSKFALPVGEENSDWATSSFTYINNGPEGWAQVHFPQYLSNEISDLVLDPGTRQIKLKETVTDVSVYTFGSDFPSSVSEVSVKLNQTEYNPVSYPELQCRNNTINVISFNKTTTSPYISIPVQYPDKKACGRRPEAIASFLSTEVETGNGKDLIQLITNVTAGDSVVLFSIGSPGYGSWSSNVKAKLSELGISLTQINSIIEGEPVVIFAKKGAASGSAVIHKSLTDPFIDQSIQVEGTITGKTTAGSMTSSLIGPALEWQNIFVKTRITELPQTDQFTFDVIGVMITGEEELLKSDISESVTEISDINTELYPYLKLVYHAEDEVNLTPPQLLKWLVTYTPVAEGVLVFNGNTDQQTLQEGDTWSDSFGFYNISQKEFIDSLTVEYMFFNTSFRSSSAFSKRIKAPLPGEQTDFNLDFNTLGKAGLNNLKIFVNPRILPEVYYDNNIIELNNYLNVRADEYSPVMELTVDGRHLINGDYVSSNPAIRLTVWDENPLLHISDTTGVKMFLKYPCEECNFTQIYFSRTDVQWSPASTTADFTMEFKPQNLPAGIYELLAEARDVSGNRAKSGNDSTYRINFVVSSENSITIQGPYPNPSSSTIFFNVVVAGDLLPDAMHLQIISMDGREIFNFVKKDFYTGINTVPWPGNDAGGNPMPGGLYFYRMVITGDGNESKSSSGKLMLVR